MKTENKELKKRVSRVEKMVANLTTDQQVMVKSFDATGDRHSRSLNHHQTELDALRRENDKLQTNLNTIVDKCTILRTRVESMGDNLCRWLRKKSLVKISN